MLMRNIICSAAVMAIGWGLTKALWWIDDTKGDFALVIALGILGVAIVTIALRVDARDRAGRS